MNSVLYLIWESLALRLTVITAFIFIIKLAFKNRLTARMHCAVWLILLVQLLFCMGGVKIQAPVSIYNAAPSEIAQYPAEYISEAVNTSAVDIRNIIVMVWVTGAAALLLWYAGVFILHRRRVKRYAPYNTARIMGQIREIRSLLGIDPFKKITVRRGNNAQTVGDTIVLPEGFSENEEYHIMLHELCHYRHRDNLKLWTALIVACINWFNPLIWLAFKRFRTDIEMLCDEHVLEVTDRKKEYARVLVKSASVRNRFVPGTASVHNGKNEVTARVKRIATLHRIKPIWRLISLCCCITVACMCLTDAVTVAVEHTITEETAVDIAEPPAPADISEIVPAVIPAAEPVTEEQIPVGTDGETGENIPAESHQVEEQESGNANAAERDEQPASDAQSSSAAVSSVSENVPVSSEPEETVPEETAAPAAENTTEVSEPEVQPDTVLEQENSESGSVTESGIGDSREEIYAAAGEPESVSAGGSKETYTLDDGSTAILHYDGDTLENGFIISE